MIESSKCNEKQSGDSENNKEHSIEQSLMQKPLDPPNKEVDSSCYRYENDKYFYTDPSSGTEFEWNEEQKEWSVKGNTLPYGEGSNKNYFFNGETYTYTDETQNIKYKWDLDKNEWMVAEGDKSKIQESNAPSSGEEEFDEGETRPEIKRQDMSQGVYGFDGDNHTYTDSKDGTVYMWDRVKSAWFPKIDDDFLARYQMSYGVDTSEPNSEAKVQPQESPKQVAPAKATGETLKRKQDPTWFDLDDKSNTKVYVSNLPVDMTEAEFVDLMQKCGLVMKDVDTGKMKVKLYTDPESKIFKGDALCTYIKVESVELALKILDGYEVKGKKIKVERAKFTMKGAAYDPSLKPKKKRKKDLDKLKKMQQKLFDWRPEKMRGEREKFERIVIIKNLFEPSLFDKDVGLILEYQQDLREECSKCGDVRKVTIHDRHHEGVAQIIFKEAEAADACVQLLNGRWFGQRQITAATWDGKTKYKVEETKEQTEERLKKWEKFIEEENKCKRDQVETSKDSDQDTRSSAGSEDDTDEEADTGSIKSSQSDPDRATERFTK